MYKRKEPYRCLRCQKTLPASDFSYYAYTTNQGKRFMRRDGRCKQCNRERIKERRHRDMAKTRDHARQYRASLSVLERVPIMAQAPLVKYGLPANKRTMELSRQALIMAQFGELFLDAYSGQLIERPTIDHIVPLCDGGKHELENLAVTSIRNNVKKNRKSLLQWMAFQRASST